METCYITFGQKYGRETHPVDGRAHPDGWFEFEADTYAEALAAAQAYLMGSDGFGRRLPLYAFDHVCPPGVQWYPRGCLARFQVRDGRVVQVQL